MIKHYIKVRQNFPLALHHDIITIGTTIPPMKGGELLMLQNIFLNIVAPIIVGIVLKLFSEWLDKKDDD